MDMLKEWGLNCVLILDEDGTGVLDMFLEIADLKWEAKEDVYKRQASGEPRTRLPS